MMAQRRITDSLRAREPRATLAALAANYAPGDSDLAWAGVTMWRSVLAAALDEPPFEPVTSATVAGSATRPTIPLLAGWLAARLRVPVTIRPDGSDAISQVVLDRGPGPITLARPRGSEVAVLSRAGRPDQEVNLPKRVIENCLMEELRRLDPDVTYEQALRQSLTVPVLAAGGSGAPASTGAP
jgi:glucose-6-phosphate dehydrogenase assembly protein OpcA